MTNLISTVKLCVFLASILTSLSVYIVFLCLVSCDQAVAKDKINTAHKLNEKIIQNSPANYLSRFPKILSPADIDFYKKAFELQRLGNIKKANLIISKIQNPILFGHILEQKYMHPTAHLSTFSELRDWLKEYADHPDAKRVYKLAMRRKPENASHPKKPWIASYKSSLPITKKNIKSIKIPSKELSKTDLKSFNKLQWQMRSRLRRGWPTGARKILQSKDYMKLATPEQSDIYRERIAWSYYIYNKDKLALELSSQTASRSNQYVPSSDWTAGIASWRLGNISQASKHFERLANNERGSEEQVTKAAFWASRTNLILGNPQKSYIWLREAAKNRYSFYGLLAKGILGKHPNFNWKARDFDKNTVQLLHNTPPLQRALALYEVGQIKRAENEIKHIRYRLTPEMAEFALLLASKLNLHATSTSIASRLVALEGENYDYALYPIPSWVPQNGYNIDPALIFALIRQESRFRASAKSRRGAKGLMQLMPLTAKFTARMTGIGKINTEKLMNPEVNITLGQAYVEHLLKNQINQYNLFFTLASYNAGPGNFNKWVTKTKHSEDPLLFLESIRSRETRDFIRNVVSNYWIYRIQMRKDTPTLLQLATGSWPIYKEYSDLREQKNGTTK
tara:strand:- start:11342 stop:13213 length:1872 start_codon:yes stop_codon:yes gene_type:complete